MTKPTIRVGQEWEKAHSDGWNSPPTRIRVLEVGTNRHEVATVTEDGRLVRKRSLVASAFSNTPSGYMLMKDAPPEAKAEEASDPPEYDGTGMREAWCAKPEAKGEDIAAFLDKVRAENVAHVAEKWARENGELNPVPGFAMPPPSVQAAIRSHHEPVVLTPVSLDRETWGETKARVAAPEAKASDPDGVHAEHCTMDACKYGDPKCPMAPTMARTVPCRQCGGTGGRHSAACDLYCHVATPPAAPSPLEVVRHALHHMKHWSDHAGDVRKAEEGERALATLEESIRAEEREACAKVAVDIADSWRAAYPEAEDAATKEVVEWAERACMDVAHSIRARKG